MNNVNLVGRLAKGPIARDNGDTRITELTLVTERPRIRQGKTQKDPDTGYTITDAEFHKVTIFNGMGMPIREHKAKGDQLAVTGRIHYKALEALRRALSRSGTPYPYRRNSLE